MKRVLHILVGGGTYTGVASYLYQQYLNIDRNQLQYDFFFCNQNAMKLVMHDSVFENSCFYELGAVSNRGKSVDYVKLYKGLKRFLKGKQYEAVVVNTSAIPVIAVCMMAARKSKALLIAHAHNAEFVVAQKSFRHKYRAIVKLVENALAGYIRKHASYLFTCSETAAEVTFGVSSKDNTKVRVIKNAINLDKFSFKEGVRLRVRKEMDVSDDTVVYGNVGRLSKGKNQMFLVKVFSEIHRTNENSQLWLIGDGGMRSELEKQISELKLENAVKLLGQRSDVSDLMQAMDSFVFTTLSEGLGIVAVESQAAGLPTTISDGVPDDVMLTELVQKIPLRRDATTWANQIIDHDSKFAIRRDTVKELKEAGYDILCEASKMQEFYCSIQ